MKRIDFLLDHGAIGKMRDNRRKVLEKRKRELAECMRDAKVADEFAYWREQYNAVESELRGLR